MKKTMTNQAEPQSWLSAIAEAAKLQGFELPPFDGYGMGTLRSATTAGGRFVTLKRRLGPSANAEVDGVEWALWHQPENLPVLIAVFRDPVDPEKANVAADLLLFKGWLVDEWAPEEAKVAVSKHPGYQPIKEPDHQFAGK